MLTNTHYYLSTGALVLFNQKNLRAKTGWNGG